MRLTFALSLLSGAAALPEPSATTSHKVSLSKGRSLTHVNGRANIPGILASLNATLAKVGREPLPHYEPVALQQATQSAERHKEKTKKHAKVNLNDQGTLETIHPISSIATDMIYYGPVTIGSVDGNAQLFELIFDTGSSDIWVPGRDCGRFDGCVHSTKYDGGGIDLEMTVPLEYMEGSAFGHIYVDDVTIAGLRSVNQTLISVTSAAGFEDKYVDGVCGMALSASPEDNGTTTFFENLVASGAVEKDEFSFYLGRLASGTGNDSELTLGGRDRTKHTGSFITVPVVSKTEWKVALDNITVNGLVAGLNTPGVATIDTGTSFIFAPLTAAEEIMSQIPGSLTIPIQFDYDSFENHFIFPCDTPDSYIPSITFAGASFQINPLDFNIGKLANEDVDLFTQGNKTLAAAIRAKIDVADYCFAGLMGLDFGESEDFNEYIVGDTFLKNWYTVMSYSANNGSPAVLFAPSIGNDSS